MEERMKDMIHETLKSGGGITETKGHDQELIVALMSVKCSLQIFQEETQPGKKPRLLKMFSKLQLRYISSFMSTNS
jgi:hypothetical protein